MVTYMVIVEDFNVFHLHKSRWDLQPSLSYHGYHGNVNIYIFSLEVKSLMRDHKT